MLHFSKSLVCCLVFGTAPLLNADVEIKPETINHPGPYRPWSLEFQQVNPEDLYNIDAVDLAKMSLDDPLLKYAYIEIFLNSMGSLEGSEPAQALALADMRNRGESATPILLKLAAENQETIYEIRLLNLVDQVGTVSLEPYLRYTRNLLRERTQSMSASAAGSAAQLLAKHGNKKDLILLSTVLEQRPYVADDVSKSLKALQQRLNPPKQGARPKLRSGRPESMTSNDGTSDRKRNAPTGNGSDKPSSNFWLAWVLLVIVALSMLGLLFKRRLLWGR